MASPPSSVEGECLTQARLLPEAQALVIAQQVAEGLQGGLQHDFCHDGGPMHMCVRHETARQYDHDARHANPVRSIKLRTGFACPNPTTTAGCPCA